MKFIGWYSVVIGLLMLGQWGFFLAAGQVPEAQTAPMALAFHLAAEAATALMLLASGVALLRALGWGQRASLAALGMLTYTVIVSPGYFAQKGVWPLVFMFAALLVLTLLSVRTLLQAEK